MGSKLTSYRGSHDKVMKFHKKQNLHKIQEALFNIGFTENYTTLAHLSYFLTNNCKTRHKTMKRDKMRNVKDIHVHK